MPSNIVQTTLERIRRGPLHDHETGWWNAGEIEQLAEILAPAARPAARLDLTLREPSAPPLPATASRFGGASPYAEFGDDWPMCPFSKEPMTLVAQLDLATLPDPPLGLGGVAVFFYSYNAWKHGAEIVGTPGTWVVRYYDAPSTDRAIDLAAPAGTVVFPECSVDPVPIATLPGWEEFDAREPAVHAACLAAYPDYDDDDLSEVMDDEFRGYRGDEYGAEPPDFQMQSGGWPSWANYPAWLRDDDYDDVALLLQVDSARLTQIGWGDTAMWLDSGVAYIVVAPGDVPTFRLTID